MALRRMENILIVVDDLEAVTAFFVALGLRVVERTDVGGPTVDRLIGLRDVRATLRFLSTPQGDGQIELDKFHSPEAIPTEPARPPVNVLGMRRIMFSVDDVDETVAAVHGAGAELVGEVVQYGDAYRLAYIRGPEGLIVGLSQRL